MYLNVNSDDSILPKLDELKIITGKAAVYGINESTLIILLLILRLKFHVVLFVDTIETEVGEESHVTLVDLMF